MSGGAITFALNQIVAPRLGCRALVELAARLGCVGVELRNDIAGVAPFGGVPANEAKAIAEAAGIRILALAEVKRFNDWSDERHDQALRLIETAVACGAEAISLIPVNDPGYRPSPDARKRNLRLALGGLAEEIAAAGLTGLIEPLGFPAASLRTKREVVDALAEIDGGSVYRLVHDTFHHHLAGESEVFPAFTGIVHISGVSDPEVPAQALADGDRGLVDGGDRLGTVEQVMALIDGGYGGSISYEPFAKSVHRLADPEPALRKSLDFVRACLIERAA